MARTITRRSFAALAVGVPGIAALYACTPGEPPPPSPTANVAITQRQTGGAAAEESTAPETVAGLPTIEVGAFDLYFEPPNISIPPDMDIQVTLNNQGAAEHNWVVTQPGLETPLLNGGESGSVTVNLPAGTYEVICSVPGHAEAGMVGVLTVDPAAPVPAAPAGGAEAGGTPAATTGEAAPAAATTFEVGMFDLYFEPADLTIPAGTDVTVTAINNGAAEHNWAVVEADLRTPIVGGGVTESVVVNLPAGSYDVICEVPGHAGAGMVGVLTVQ